MSPSDADVLAALVPAATVVGRRLGTTAEHVIRVWRQGRLPRRRRPITDDEAQAMHEMREAGLTFQQIGDKTGRAVGTVWPVLNRPRASPQQDRRVDTQGQKQTAED